MSDDYQQYLERKHAGFQTPEDLVFRWVYTATGRRPVSRQKLVRGNDNEVYQVATATGEDYIVRIRRGEATELETEAWVIEQYRRAGVPVPVVHLVDREEHGGSTLEFMVQARLPGRPLSQLDRQATGEAWAGLCRQAGEMLGRMHSVTVGGFYHLRPDGIWDFADWGEMMDSTVSDREGEREWILRAGFTEDEFACMLRLVARYRDEFACPQPVLCHGDFLTEHVFADEDFGICGVVDFGNYQGDHPIHDLAVLLMEEAGLELSRVLEGYPESPFRSDRFDTRLHLHRLSLGMGYLAYHMQVEHYPEIALNTRDLRHTLQCLHELGL